MTTAPSISLKVAEADSKDVGRGLARMDPEDLERLGAQVGDIVEIQGKKTTVAKAMPAFKEVRGQGLIQIDGLIRTNATIGLGERVSVRKVNAHRAGRVVLTPLGGRSALSRERDMAYVEKLLDGLPLMAGDRIRAALFGARFQDFTVESTVPKGVVVIHTETVIQIQEQKGEGVGDSRISYEDIGGLGKAVERIREMVELPMKYPELFERLGIEPPKGVLLHGPPGTGETLRVRAVAREAEALGDLQAAKIFIGGVPQYDDYADPALRMSREEFAAAVGLDPAKKILLYAMGGIMNQDDPTGHLAILDEAIEAGRLPPATVILRAHPKYDIGVLGINRFKNVLFYQPGKKVVRTKGEWEFDREDVRILLNMLRHADVELNTGSTLSIESAIFDRPVVLAAFDSPKTRGYYHSVRHGLDVTHYRFVQATGGVARANDPAELVCRVKEYLDDPTRDAAGRKRLVAALVGEPGGAGPRIGQFVLSQLNR